LITHPAGKNVVSVRQFYGNDSRLNLNFQAFFATALVAKIIAIIFDIKSAYQT